MENTRGEQMQTRSKLDLMEDRIQEIMKEKGFSRKKAAKHHLLFESSYGGILKDKQQKAYAKILEEYNNL